MTKIYQCIVLLSLLSCHSSPKIDEEAIKNEIKSVEAAFAKTCKEQSIAEGFWFYADSNAIIKRGADSLIKGKEAIRHYYESDDRNAKATVTWAPDFVGLSKDGTLAYTYGQYTWTIVDSANRNFEKKGVFHTVWKKQANGEWKYVWD